MANIDQIDKFNGPIMGLLPLLDVFINDARAKKDYKTCVNLCGATRSAFMRVHHECTLYPNTPADVFKAFATNFASATDHLKRLLLKVDLAPEEKDHLDGMISNISYRIDMLKALAETTLPIEKRIANVGSIGKLMVIEQGKLRSLQLQKQA